MNYKVKFFNRELLLNPTIRYAIKINMFIFNKIGRFGGEYYTVGINYVIF